MPLPDRAKGKGNGALKGLMGGKRERKEKTLPPSDERVQKNFWMPKSLEKRMRLYMLENDIKREAEVMRDALDAKLAEEGF